MLCLQIQIYLDSLSPLTFMISSSVLPSLLLTTWRLLFYWQHDVCAGVGFSWVIMSLLLAVKEMLCECVCVCALWRGSMNQEWFMWYELGSHIVLAIILMLFFVVFCWYITFPSKCTIFWDKWRRWYWVVVSDLIRYKEGRQEKKERKKQVCRKKEWESVSCLWLAADTHVFIVWITLRHRFPDRY